VPVKLGTFLKDARMARGLSLRAFARRAGVSPSFLAKVEAAQTSPSLDSLRLLSAALDLSVADMLGLVEKRGEADVVERNFRGHQVTVWEGVELRHFLPDHLSTYFSVLVMDLGPGSSTPVRAAQRSVKELGVVLEGRVVCHVMEKAHRLGRGSAIHFDLSLPHRWENTVRVPARVLLINPNFTEVVDVGTPDPRRRGLARGPRR
jgi:transcriptional regulator with XRE-family HTH domain